MIRRYPLSEEGKQYMLRRQMRRSYVTAAAMVVITVPTILRDAGPEGVSTPEILMFLAIAGVIVVGIVRTLHKSRDAVQRIAFLLSDDEIAEMRGNVTMIAVPRERIGTVEADADGTLYVMTKENAVAMVLRPHMVDSDDLRLRLSHEYGIRPRTAPKSKNVMTIFRRILPSAALLVIFFVDAPIIVGSVLAVYTVLFLWSVIEIHRLYDARSQLVKTLWVGGMFVLVGILRLAALLHWI